MSMNQFQVFTGGVLETNAFYLETPAGNLLFDAPEGADDFFAGHRIDWLLLTHGHFDHVMDAAKIQRRHGCRVVGVCAASEDLRCGSVLHRDPTVPRNSDHAHDRHDPDADRADMGSH